MGLNDQSLRIIRINGAEYVATDARVKLAVCGIHAELLNFPLRDAFDLGQFRCRHIIRADEKIAIPIHRRVHAWSAAQPGVRIQPGTHRR